MENYETEEQQVEAIKKWWSENFKMVLFVAIVGIGGIIAIQQWKQYQANQTFTASTTYDQILRAGDDDNQSATMHQQVQTMQADYAKFSYTALAVMLEAKKLLAEGKLADAEQNYRWVIDNSKAQSLQHIARIRMATVMSAQGKQEEALNVLEVEQGQFKASYLETKGDILVALERINEAKAAYDQALQAYAAIGANAQILQVKRNDLGNS